VKSGDVSAKDIYETGTQRLKQRLKKCVDNEEDYVEKYS
jgi:hypothetical protein